MLTDTVRIGRDTIVAIEPGTRFLYAGSPGSATAMTAVFLADGDNVAIVVADGGRAFVECAKPSPFVYAVAMHGHDGLTVTGLWARDCQHVWVSAATDEFARIQTVGVGANVARRVVIRGGGAQYAEPQRQGQGACLMTFVIGGVIRDAAYANVAHGLEWWGGNADPTRPPAEGGAATERKCRDLLIENVSVRQAAAAGIWGSMGENVTVRGCRVDDVGDVGFDAEGSNKVLFERCSARNARNGCFSTFFLCDGVRVVDCHAVVDRREYPLVRVYNETQSNVDDRRFEVTGGTFECRDSAGPGTIDTAMGPVREFTLSDASLINVRVDVAFFNMHATTISRNTMIFSRSLRGLAAIRAGSSKTAPSAHGTTAGSVLIEGNRIHYAVEDGGTAISVREDDFNGAATDRIHANLVSGPFETGIAISNATANVGIVPTVAISANRFTDLAPTAKLLSLQQEGPVARRPAVTWDDGQLLNGRPIALAEALGRTRAVFERTESRGIHTGAVF